MKKHFALAFCLVLAGCTDSDWDRALNYVYPAPDDADLTSDASPPPAPRTQNAAASVTSSAAPAPSAPAAPANADFCRAVATQDATANDFDPTTQQKVFARSYGQCVAIYSR
ncbi:MAG TPA: hypothetical protein VH189_03180 [Rhizomicrobium sp.]|jgi:hypothetical protein|nr:hypothetical protein [Rhizomicrobium sp.]